jgi:hypothetical protein
MFGIADFVVEDTNWSKLCDAIETPAPHTRVPFSLTIRNKVTGMVGTIGFNAERHFVFKDSAEVPFATWDPRSDSVVETIAPEHDALVHASSQPYVHGVRFLGVIGAFEATTGKSLPIAQAWKTFQLVCDGSPVQFFGCLYVHYFGREAEPREYHEKVRTPRTEPCMLFDTTAVVHVPNPEDTNDSLWLESVARGLVEDSVRGFSESPPTVPIAGPRMFSAKPKPKP